MKKTWTSHCDTLSILSLNSNNKQNSPSSMWGPSVGRCTPSWPPSSCIPQSPSSPQTKSRSSSFSSSPPPRCRPVLWCFPLERWSGLEAQTSWGQLTGWLKVRSKTKVKQGGQKISQERPPPTPHTWLFMNPGGKMFKCYFSSLDKNLAWRNWLVPKLSAEYSPLPPRPPKRDYMCQIECKMCSDV